jgi:hypothetical protein
MAQSQNNLILAGVFGRISNIVLRKWGAKTVFSASPDFSNHKWSDLQKANRKRFGEAMAWARATLKDPEKRKYYASKKKNMQTIWNAAVSEYLKRHTPRNGGQPNP